MISEAAARKLDSEDVLAHVRERFVIPEGTIYLDGNSLGLLTHAAQSVSNKQLRKNGDKTSSPAGTPINGSICRFESVTELVN